MPDLVTSIDTRRSLHAVAEHVLSAARHAATGRIGLRPAPGGFATPAFPSDHGERVLAVEGLDIVRRDERGEARAPLTTVAAAATLAEVRPGAPTEVFTPSAPVVPEAALAVDPEAAATIAAWFALADEALAAFLAAHPDDGPVPAQLWPEHFDLGAQLGQVNYGASPGDASHELPYLYVGPWAPPEPDGEFWNQPYGASIAAAEVTTVDDALAFLHEGRRRSAELG